jgi:hypothetical protein
MTPDGSVKTRRPVTISGSNNNPLAGLDSSLGRAGSSHQR